MRYDFYNNVTYRYYFLDFKLGDVTGDGIVDRVYLVGEKTSIEDAFSDNILIVVQDGKTNQLIRINLDYAAGYNAKLFLGNIVNKKKMDILVKIDTGGSGGYILAYLYTFMEGQISLLLDSDSFDQISTYEVNFLEGFNIEVLNEEDHLRFVLNIEERKQQYIKEGIYSDTGVLLKSMQGGVLSLGALYPIVEEYNGLFTLLAYQRIIGIDITDNLGAIETYLTWNGKHIEIDRVNAVFTSSLKNSI
ncbi:MAG: hypothetical protein ACOWWR_17085 [Eubacteriales bacterium]